MNVAEHGGGSQWEHLTVGRAKKVRFEKTTVENLTFSKITLSIILVM